MLPQADKYGEIFPEFESNLKLWCKALTDNKNNERFRYVSITEEIHTHFIE